jgi:hypothetical protein
MRAVAFDYLRETVVYSDNFARRCGGHVAVGQGVTERRGWWRELVRQRIGEPAFLGFDDRA